MRIATSITVRVPLTIRRRPGRKTVVAPEGAAAAAPTRTRADPALVKALARAFRYQRLLDEGRCASISEMAAVEKLDRGYLGRILRLALLAPDIVEAILDGRQAFGLALPRLLEPFSTEWAKQRVPWELSSAPAESPNVHAVPQPIARRRKADPRAEKLTTSPLSLPQLWPPAGGS